MSLDPQQQSSGIGKDDLSPTAVRSDDARTGVRRSFAPTVQRAAAAALRRRAVRAPVVVRVITGADELTAPGTMSATLRLAMPLLLAALAGLWAERAGIVNIGIEGMMILGTWFGGWGAWQFGAWPGIVLGMVGGASAVCCTRWRRSGSTSTT